MMPQSSPSFFVDSNDSCHLAHHFIGKATYHQELPGLRHFVACENSHRPEERILGHGLKESYLEVLFMYIPPG